MGGSWEGQQLDVVQDNCRNPRESDPLTRIDFTGKVRLREKIFQPIPKIGNRKRIFRIFSSDVVEDNCRNLYLRSDPVTRIDFTGKVRLIF